MANLRKARAKKARKGALGKLRDRKENGGGEPKKALAALRQARKASSQHDFNMDGILYHNVRVLGRVHDIPWGSVDLTNGDTTYTAHNRYGSWMVGDPHEIDAVMKEPASLGWGDQVTLCTNLVARFEADLKVRGIKTAAELRAEREEADAKERRRLDAQEKRLATLAAKRAAKSK